MTESWGYYPQVSLWVHSADVRVGDGAVQYTLKNVHPETQCGEHVCIIHNPTDHRMREWPLLWRSDTNLWERLCKHGTGHPDPDQLQYWEESGQLTKSIHGCCGCCHN